MLNDLSFNQDYTCLLVSTSEGHKIFNCDPFGEFHVLSNADGDNSATFILRMLFSTSLTIIVPQCPENVGNRILKVYNLKQNLKICELTFPLGIVDLKLNRKRLVVFLEIGQIYIYDLSSIKLIKVLEIEPLSLADGLVSLVADLSPDDNSLLVLPVLLINEQTEMFDPEFSGELPKVLDLIIEFTHKNEESMLSRQTSISLKDVKRESKGWVLIYDTVQLRSRLLYKAHDSSIAKISISTDSRYIATASSKGTIVRVSHLKLAEDQAKPNLTQIINLRRGHNPAKITALKFNLDLTVLGCASDNDTVHIFRIHGREDPGQEHVDSDVSNEAYASEDDSRSRLSSLEDLNENLASLLILKKPAEADPKKESKSYFASLKSGKILNNQYTKLLIKRLPYKNYLENLIWEKPRRSFAFVKLPPSTGNSSSHRMEIGFSNTGLLMLASYKNEALYQFHMPSETSPDRRECKMVLQDSLVI